jgi:hypothetical protein
VARPKSHTVNWQDFYHPVKDAAPRRSGIMSYGPAELGGREIVVVQGGPRDFVDHNPGLFATSSTSEEEGWFYWGCLQELGPHGVEGGWTYQRQVRPYGARVGQATIDFVIDVAPRPLAVRIQTPYFHAAIGPEQDGFDDEQLLTLEDSGYDVIDVPSDLYMDDESGLAVRRMVRRVVNRDPILMPGSATYELKG